MTAAPHRIDFLPPGSRLGRYELEGPLAVGGMAELYLARLRGVEGFDKRVVVKRMLPQYASSYSYQTMFLDEARLAARLQHANIVQTSDIGCEDGAYFFVMEYVAGEDCRRLMMQCSARGFDFPLPLAVKIVIDAAAGLHAAHETLGADGEPAHVVHRDVSPSNILVSFDGCVKLIDFGVAKAARRQTETRTGQLKGKSAYMAPEQCRAEPVDRRTDIFQLGIVLYELTTGQRLFTGKTDYEILERVAHATIAPPSRRVDRYPAELERIVMCCLARRPEDRYQTAEELQLALEEFARYEAFERSAVALGLFVRTMFPRKYRLSREPLPEPAERGTAAEVPWAASDVTIEEIEVDGSSAYYEVEVVDQLAVGEPVIDVRHLLAEHWRIAEHDRVAHPIRAVTVRGSGNDTLLPTKR
jgi:serine/threonine protein kinase